MRFERLGIPIVFLGLAWAQGTGTPTLGEHSSPVPSAKPESGPAADSGSKSAPTPAIPLKPGVPGAPAAVPPSGRMVIEKELVEVGDVVRGQPATAVFQIRNTGEDVLKILEARPG